MPELDDAVERSQALRERLASNTVPTNPDDDVPLHLVGDSIGLGWMYPGGERLDVVVVDGSYVVHVPGPKRPITLDFPVEGFGAGLEIRFSFDEGPGESSDEWEGKGAMNYDATAPAPVVDKLLESGEATVAAPQKGPKMTTDLGNFEGKRVSGSAIRMNVGSGLSDAQVISPQLIEIGEQGYSLVKWECVSVEFDPGTPDTDDEGDTAIVTPTMKRVHVLKALGATNIPSDLNTVGLQTVDDMIDRVKKYRADMKAAKEGKDSLPGIRENT